MAGPGHPRGWLVRRSATAGSRRRLATCDDDTTERGPARAWPRQAMVMTILRSGGARRDRSVGGLRAARLLRGEYDDAPRTRLNTRAARPRGLDDEAGPVVVPGLAPATPGQETPGRRNPASLVSQAWCRQAWSRPARESNAAQAKAASAKAAPATIATPKIEPAETVPAKLREAKPGSPDRRPSDPCRPALRHRPSPRRRWPAGAAPTRRRPRRSGSRRSAPSPPIKAKAPAAGAAQAKPRARRRGRTWTCSTSLRRTAPPLAGRPRPQLR